jgi:hypothetical protein
MSTIAPKISIPDTHIKAIFVNGIFNSEEAAEEAAESIEEIVKCPAESFYNDSSCDVARIAMDAFASVVTGVLSGAFNGIRTAVTSFVTSQSKINQRKEKTAQELAYEIKSFLKTHRYNRLMLIGHSQGRDICAEALDLLKEKYTNKTYVMTLGSAPIDQDAAKEVENFVHKNDLVPSVMKGRDMVTNRRQYQQANITVLKGDEDPITSHTLGNYLEYVKVEKKLRSMEKKMIGVIKRKAESEGRPIKGDTYKKIRRT